MRVFHTEIQVLPNGSGDTTYNYIQVFCLPDFLLINRGFHWINEYPFNR